MCSVIILTTYNCIKGVKSTVNMVCNSHLFVLCWTKCTEIHILKKVEEYIVSLQSVTGNPTHGTLQYVAFPELALIHSERVVSRACASITLVPGYIKIELTREPCQCRWCIEVYNHVPRIHPPVLSGRPVFMQYITWENARPYHSPESGALVVLALFRKWHAEDHRPLRHAALPMRSSRKTR